MTTQTAFSVVAKFYALANLGSMGLELKLRETLKALRSVRVVALTLVWCWVVSPAFAVLLTKILPTAEPYALGLIIFSLAPTAPMLPILIRRARADIFFAAAIMPLAVVSTVILMPLLAPLLIPGLTLSRWDIGKTLLISMLLPLVIGVVIKVYAARVADKIFLAVKKIAGISTVLLLGFVVLVNWRVLLSTLGSFAVAALVLFTLGLALVAYIFGFGLNRAQRGAMALGVGSRNGSAMLMAVTAFPVIDPKLMARSLLTVPLPLVVWLALASFFASRASATAEGNLA